MAGECLECAHTNGFSWNHHASNYFAEDYACEYQDEAQDARWFKSQLTLFTHDPLDSHSTLQTWLTSLFASIRFNHSSHTILFVHKLSSTEFISNSFLKLLTHTHCAQRLSFWKPLPINGKHLNWPIGRCVSKKTGHNTKVNIRNYQAFVAKNNCLSCSGTAWDGFKVFRRTVNCTEHVICLNNSFL
jgi:hypothetical protein